MTSTNISYSEKLRSLATWLDEHPTVAAELNDQYEYPTVAVYVYEDDSAEETKFERFQSFVRTLGSFEKSGYGGALTADHFGRQDDTTLFRVSVTTSGVCERIEKTDDSGAPVMQKKRTYVESDELEPVYEWKCPDSWIA